jgi:predicted nucleotide-binding protein
MDQSKLSALITRLRDFEVQCLRLATVDVQNEMQATKTTYEERLRQLEASHSRSWFGEHANTYYEDFQPPPAGRSFDVEWGFIPGFSGGRNRGWRIYSREQLREFAFRDIGEKIFYELNTLSDQTIGEFSIVRDQVIDVLDALSNVVNSRAVNRYKERIEQDLKPYDASDYVNGRAKATPRMTRDSEEIAKGQTVPIQVQYLATIQSLQVTKTRARELATVLRNAIEATSMYEPARGPSKIPNTVFIGHGRSELWRVLKDFVSERLCLPYEEFNRISVAGIGTQERLAEMLDRCGFAFLILSAEDLHSDGSLHARENVIHEAGLFQGRLGWRKAIVLVEEGCEEFSNIVGLGQIRFPKKNISACFEDVRRG